MFQVPNDPELLNRLFWNDWIWKKVMIYLPYSRFIYTALWNSLSYYFRACSDLEKLVKVGGEVKVCQRRIIPKDNISY